MSNLEEELIDWSRWTIRPSLKICCLFRYACTDMHVNLFVLTLRWVNQIKVITLKAWADKTFRDQFKGTSHHMVIILLSF